MDDLAALVRTGKNEEARAAAARTLGYLAERRGVDALLEVIADGNAPDAAKEAAVAALGFASDPAPLPWRTGLTSGAPTTSPAPRR